MSGLELHGLKFGWSAVRGEHKWNYDENHVKKSCLSQFQSYQDFELYITAIEDSWRDAD